MTNFKSWIQAGNLPLSEINEPTKLERYFYERVADEQEFLDWYKKQDLPIYEKPSVTVDLVAMTYSEKNGVSILMIERAANPFRGKLALAGGFIDPTESAEEACLREVEEELSLVLDKSRLIALKPRTEPNRDPRGWVISFPYLVYLTEEEFELATAGDDAASVKKLQLGDSITNFHNDLKTNSGSYEFAFDHRHILDSTFDHLKYLAHTNPSFLQMLGEFTLSQSSNLVNMFAQNKIVIQNHFLYKYSSFIEEVGVSPNSGGRPARLYKFKEL